MYALSQVATVVLLGLTIDDYAEFVGPRDQTHPIVLFRNIGVSGGYTIPYRYVNIATSEDLVSNLTTSPADGYLLRANLTLTSWTPLRYFADLLDGNDHTISFADGTGPLFDTINNSGTVRNLGIINSTLAAVNNGRILSVYATGNRSCAAADCDSGGLVDRNNGTIIDSHARGNSSCAGTTCNSGGLVGTNAGSITGSYATGAIACNGNGCGSGGLVGRNEATILRSYALGDVTAAGGAANQLGVGCGGLVGTNANTVTRSYAIGNTVCSGDNSASGGGLIGNSDSIQNAVVRQSYATGNSTCMGPFCVAGGLIGDLGRGLGIHHSYAVGDNTCVGVPCSTGGIVGGRILSSHEVTASYKAQNVGDGAYLHRTLAQLRCPTMANQTCAMGTNTYEGWDNTIWDFGTADDLPTLRDLPDCPTFRPNCRH